MPPRPLTRLRKLALALPEAHEVEAWGAPTFRVKNKLFAMYAAPNNHHGEGREGVEVGDAGEALDELGAAGEVERVGRAGAASGLR